MYLFSKIINNHGFITNLRVSDARFTWAPHPRNVCDKVVEYAHFLTTGSNNPQWINHIVLNDEDSCVNEEFEFLKVGHAAVLFFKKNYGWLYTSIK